MDKINEIELSPKSERTKNKFVKNMHKLEKALDDRKWDIFVKQMKDAGFDTKILEG
jgi:hypothetical protein